MDWTALLAYISGSLDDERFLRNEYLVAENRILRDQIKGRVQLSDTLSGAHSIALSGNRVDGICSEPPAP